MIVKRYTRPFAFESKAVRAQFAEFARDPSTGIAIDGPVVEQDLTFADDCAPEIIAAMDGLMVRAGWATQDAPTDKATVRVPASDGSLKRLEVPNAER